MLKSAAEDWCQKEKCRKYASAERSEVQLIQLRGGGRSPSTKQILRANELTPVKWIERQQYKE